MKKTVLLLSFVFIFSAFAYAQTVSFKEMPQTVKQFVELRNKIATTPEGGATMFIIALKMYEKNTEIGKQCIVIATDRSRLQVGNTYKNFQLFATDMNRIKRQIEQYPYVPNSYFMGASPSNSYKSKRPYKLTFSSNPYSGNIDEGNFKIFVKSYGADSPRPIRMIKNNKGYWKAKEWSTIIMGVSKPEVTVDDDL